LPKAQNDNIAFQLFLWAGEVLRKRYLIFSVFF